MIDIAKIWHDAAHRGPPVLVKRQKGDLLLRMTFSKDNRSLIEGSGRADWLLRWNKGGAVLVRTAIVVLDADEAPYRAARPCLGHSGGRGRLHAPALCGGLYARQRP